MGGEGAPLTAQDSVADMRTRIAELTLADSGSFISHAGGSIPW